MQPHPRLGTCWQLTQLRAAANSTTTATILKQYRSLKQSCSQIFTLCGRPFAHTSGQGIFCLEFHLRATQQEISYHDNMRYMSNVPHVAAIDQVDLNNGTINTSMPRRRCFKAILLPLASTDVAKNYFAFNSTPHTKLPRRQQPQGL